MIIILRIPETHRRGRVISTAKQVFCGVLLSDSWHVWLPPVRTGYAATSGPLLGRAAPQLLGEGHTEGTQGHSRQGEEKTAGMGVGSHRPLFFIPGRMAPQLLHGLVLPASQLL